MPTNTGTAAPLVELRGLRKSYHEGDSEHTVLADATAVVRRGELVVLVGPSGSGKSTLLNLVSGIDVPSAGEVVIDGVALTALGERERTLFRRRRIGFIFQSFNLIPTLTVEENLLLPLELNGRTGARERARVAALLGRVGLDGRGRSWPDRLSGGEQQRVAVARALVHDPALVLADEPTGNLDAETAEGVLGLLDELTRGAGRTMLVVTHAPRVVELADRVLTIRKGHLVEEAVPALQERG
ncbi:MAG TPA: ABC transporter ATP-binding protein [Longimicrobiales bacterium]|nr:ABC transporter ATP-binding protein [Longimicrobiales bacterium]